MTNRSGTTWSPLARSCMQLVAITRSEVLSLRTDEDCLPGLGMATARPHPLVGGGEPGPTPSPRAISNRPAFEGPDRRLNIKTSFSNNVTQN